MAYHMKPAPMPANFEDFERLRFPTCWKRTGGTTLFRDPVLASMVGDDIEYGSLFAYLFLRWGMPNCPWVLGRSLASYLLTTPRTDMLMGVTPTFSGKTEDVFRFYVPGGTRTRGDLYLAELKGAGPEGRPHTITRWADDDPLKEYALAAVKTLTHFKRPLPLGEGSIDPFGPVYASRVTSSPKSTNNAATNAADAPSPPQQTQQ